MDIGNFLQNLFQPQTISSGVPSSEAYGSGQGMPPETDVLQRLLGGNPVNVMQQAGIDPNMPQPAPVAQQPQPAAQAPRPRRSLLETIGRISDVLATTGGATPLYEPTINAREDRARQIQADQQKLAAGAFEIGDKGNARAGMALRGLQAIQRGGGDVNKAWPILAAQAGIPPERAAEMAQIFAQDPSSIDGLAETFNGHEGKYAKQVNIAVDPATGKTIAYQVDDSGNVHQVALPENYSPVDPMQTVDLGGKTGIIGRNSGNIKRIIPKTERPGAAAERESRERIAGGRNDTAITIAGMPARSNSNTASGVDPSVVSRTAEPLLRDMKDALERIRKAGGINAPEMGPMGRVNAAALENVPLYERVANPEGYSARQDIQRLASTGVFSLLPLMSPTIKVGSRNIDTEKEFKRLSDVILNAKDYNSALRGIQSLETIVKAASQPTTPVAPRPRGQSAPRASSSGQWGKARVVGQ